MGPLGFHPQVRWPTRCKRCFRDYKEHSDSGDQKKFANLDAGTTESDPWSVRKGSFQKSKSVDVTIESGSSAASRFASYTTSKDTVSNSKTEEDIPEWKKAMLERGRTKSEKKRSKKQEILVLFQVQLYIPPMSTNPTTMMPDSRPGVLRLILDHLAHTPISIKRKKNLHPTVTHLHTETPPHPHPDTLLNPKKNCHRMKNTCKERGNRTRKKRKRTERKKKRRERKRKDKRKKD